MLFVMPFIVIASAFWTYFDAKRICSKVSGFGINHAYSPGFAAFMVATFWIVCFPLYLYQSYQIKKDIFEIDCIVGA